MFWIVTCFMYPRVFTKEGSCGAPQNILGLGPLKALIRPWCVEQSGSYLTSFLSYSAIAMQNTILSPFPEYLTPCSGEPRQNFPTT